MPTVSVIIPCYNHGGYLDEAVESVLAQTFQNFEIIIVDDGSTDQSTIDLLKGYNKPKTFVIRTDNQGLASARNNGIKEAKGEYILPLDADDKIGKEYLKKAVKILDENDDIGIVYCESVHFGLKKEPFRLPEYSFNQILEANIIFCSSFFRKKNWEQVGGFNINLVYGWEDWDFWLSIVELGLKVYRIPEVLFFYRLKEGSMVDSMTDEHEFFMRLHTVMNHKHLYKNVAEINILLKVAELYVDTGYGYNERQALSLSVLGNERKLEFDLTQYQNIKSLRFDPINDYCVVHINNIIIVREDYTSYEFENPYSNAVHQDGKDYVFSIRDPNIYLNGFDEKIRKVIFELEYIAIGKEAFGYVGKAYDSALKASELKANKLKKKNHEQQQKINNTIEEVRKFKRKVHQLQGEVDDKTFVYESLLNSRTWKVAKNIRSFKRLLKSVIYKCLYHKQYRKIYRSGLFDKDYYFKKQLDLHHISMDLLLHFIQFGFTEGRNPHPLFDSS